MTIRLVRRFGTFGRRFGPNSDVTRLSKPLDMDVVPQIDMVIQVEGFRFEVAELTVDPPGKVSVYHPWEIPVPEVVEAAKAAGWTPCAHQGAVAR